MRLQTCSVVSLCILMALLSEYKAQNSGPNVILADLLLQSEDLMKQQQQRQSPTTFSSFYKPYTFKRNIMTARQSGQGTTSGGTVAFASALGQRRSPGLGQGASPGFAGGRTSSTAGSAAGPAYALAGQRSSSSVASKAEGQPSSTGQSRSPINLALVSRLAHAIAAQLVSLAIPAQTAPSAAVSPLFSAAPSPPRVPQTPVNPSPPFYAYQQPQWVYYYMMMDHL